MKKLQPKYLRWLEVLPLICVSCWLGGAVFLLLLYFLKSDIDNGAVLCGINQSIHHVDMAAVVLPGALGLATLANGDYLYAIGITFIINE